MLVKWKAKRQINRWIRQSYMPPPTPSVKIILGTPPFYGGLWSTLWHERWEIWLVRNDWNSKETVHHERGHAFDRRNLDFHHRGVIQGILGKPYTPWFWGDCDHSPMDESGKPDAYEERFADAYSRCSITKPSDLSKKDRSFRNYIFNVVNI